MAQSVMDLSLSSKLREIYILRIGFIGFLLLGVILFILSLVAIKKKNEIKKTVLIPLITVFLILIISSSVLVFLNYNHNDISGYDVLNNDNYSSVFPYYENMKSNTNDGVYTVIEKDELFSSKYIGFQSSCETEENTILYNVDYFQSDNNVLLGQFIGQYAPHGSELIVENSNKDDLYQIYSNGTSYSVVISSDNAYFVMYLLNFDTINDMNSETLINDAYSVFDIIKL